MSSCSLHKGMDQSPVTKKRSARITKKFNYSKPYQSYSDKSSRRRIRKVLGHGHHKTY